METQYLPVALLVWITALAAILDARQQARFVRLCTSLLFARGRRTVASWHRGCGVGGDYRRSYYLLGSVGRKTPAIARAMFRILMKRLPAEGQDTPLAIAGGQRIRGQVTSYQGGPIEPIIKRAATR
jgi:hypothetical protein